MNDLYKRMHNKIEVDAAVVEAVLNKTHKRNRIKTKRLAVIVAAILAVTLVIPGVASNISEFAFSLFTKEDTKFAEYVTPINLSATCDDIKLEIISAVRDEVSIRVFMKATDLKGRRLSSNTYPDERIYWNTDGGGTSTRYNPITGELFIDTHFYISNKHDNDFLAWTDYLGDNVPDGWSEDWFICCVDSFTKRDSYEIISEGKWLIPFKVDEYDKNAGIRLENIQVGDITIENFYLSPFSIKYEAIGVDVIEINNEVLVSVVLKDGSELIYRCEDYYDKESNYNLISMGGTDDTPTDSNIDAIVEGVVKEPLDLNQIDYIKINENIVYSAK